MILEEQRRGEMRKEKRDIPKRLKQEIDRLYRGYELIFTQGKWVLYHVKHSSGGRSEDIMFKQCELPSTNLGMWIIPYLQKLDRGEESLKDWQLKTKIDQYEFLRTKDRDVKELYKDMGRDWENYKIKRRIPYVRAW